jgi:hypothetical protein
VKPRINPFLVTSRPNDGNIEEHKNLFKHTFRRPQTEQKATFNVISAHIECCEQIVLLSVDEIKLISRCKNQA